MKTILFILAISAVCFAGKTENEIIGREGPFASVEVYQSGDSIVVISKEDILCHVVKTVYIGKFKKTECKGKMRTVPEHEEIEWDK